MRCKKCDNEFEEWLRMSEREEPMKNPCAELVLDESVVGKHGRKKCGGEIVQAVSSMAIGDSVRLGVKKNSGEFNAVMEKIHHGTVGSKLDRKMSQNQDRKQDTLSDRLKKYEK